MLPVNSKLLPTFSKFFEEDWNNLFDWNTLSNNQFSSSPGVNIIEGDNHYLIEMAAPGLTKDRFNIEFHNGILKIAIENLKSMEDKDTNYLRKEFSYNTFQRTFNLDQHLIDEKKIDAKYDNGILKILLPKSESAKIKPAQKIKIK